MQLQSKPFSTESLTLTHGIWTWNRSKYGLGTSNPVTFQTRGDSALHLNENRAFPIDIALKGVTEVRHGTLFITTHAMVMVPVDADHPPSEISSITFRYPGKKGEVNIEAFLLPIFTLKKGVTEDNHFNIPFLNPRNWSKSPNRALGALHQILITHHIIIVRKKQYYGMPFITDLDLAVDKAHLELFFVAINQFGSFVT